MVCWQSLLIVCATLGQPAPSDAVLLDFTSAHCGPCRSMLPVVAQLEKQGYRVEKIDIDQRPDLARQFRVDGVPCFVMLSAGREVDRVIGATSYQRLAGMFQKVARPTSNQPVVRAQSPDSHAGHNAASHAGHNHAEPGHAGHGHAGHGQAPAPQMPVAQSIGEVAPAGLRATERKSLAATVRLKVDDPEGNSYGTGTIIDQHGENALVLTCGHIFRDSHGKGTITIDLFGGNQPLTVPGHLIDYDLERDVALVAMRPGVPVQSAAVAGPGFRATKGAAAFSVGCDRGAEPTVRRSRITDINRYQGKPNLEAAGMPVEGRSGGGLFTADGMLIGVCNFADEKADEGIYAAPGAFQAHLDQVGLAAVYRKTKQQPQEQLAAVVPPENDPRPETRKHGAPVVAPATFDYRQSDNTALASVPAAPQGRRTTPALNNVSLPAHAAGAEVVCIVRTRAGEERVVVLPRASQSLLEQLEREEAANRENIARASDSSNGPVIRAQSGEW